MSRRRSDFRRHLPARPDDAGFSFGTLPPGAVNLVFHLRLNRGRAQIRTVFVQGAPPRRVRPVPNPLDDRTWRKFRAGVSGLVVVALDAERRILAAGTRTGSPLGFTDSREVTRLEGRWKGGARRPRRDDRIFQILLPEDAVYLGIFDTRVLAKDGLPPGPPDPSGFLESGDVPDRALRVRLLCLYGLPRSGDPFPPLPGEPIPWPFPKTTRSVVVPADRYYALPETGWHPARDAASTRAGSSAVERSGKSADATRKSTEAEDGGNVIVGRRLLAGSGTPAGHCNIVVTGDGFSENDRQTFDRFSRRLAEEILATEPFSEFSDRINIYRIETVSEDSGITGCSSGCCATEEKRTFFMVEGNWHEVPGDASYPAFCGMSDPGRLYHAATVFADYNRVDAYIVIANCPVAGGSAFPETKLVFATTGTAGDISEADMEPALDAFVDVAIHELGHVLADLADEYIASDTVLLDEIPEHPNLIAIDPANPPGDVAWIIATDDFERSPTDNPEVPYNYGFNATLVWQPEFDTYEEDGDPVGTGPGDVILEKLGLFWGCQYVLAEDVEEETAGDVFNDSGGRKFYRPMGRCRMRVAEEREFCRVCAEALRRKLAAASEEDSDPGGSTDTAPPDAPTSPTTDPGGSASSTPDSPPPDAESPPTA